MGVQHGRPGTEVCKTREYPPPPQGKPPPLPQEGDRVFTRRGARTRSPLHQLTPSQTEKIHDDRKNVSSEENQGESYRKSLRRTLGPGKGFPVGSFVQKTGTTSSSVPRMQVEPPTPPVKIQEEQKVEKIKEKV